MKERIVHAFIVIVGLIITAGLLYFAVHVFIFVLLFGLFVWVLMQIPWVRNFVMSSIQDRIRKNMSKSAEMSDSERHFGFGAPNTEKDVTGEAKEVPDPKDSSS